MKTTIRLLGLIAALLFAGCASTPSGQHFLQPLLDRAVPADFRGDAAFSERGQYVTVEVSAGDLHRNSQGVWTWNWLEYQRTFNFPFFSGIPYKQEGRVRLGTPPSAATRTP